MSQLNHRALVNLEHDKFVLNDDNKVAVRTTGELKGEIRPTGLDKAFKTTTLDITDTAVKLPTTALEGRNAISIHNTSSNVIYIGNSDVTADNVIGTTSGYEIVGGGRVNFDVTTNVEIYAICAAGLTSRAKITEIA